APMKRIEISERRTRMTTVNSRRVMPFARLVFLVSFMCWCVFGCVFVFFFGRRFRLPAAAGSTGSRDWYLENVHVVLTIHAGVFISGGIDEPLAVKPLQI